MHATSSSSEVLAGALRTLAAAPHRLLFFVGASNVLLSMLWWAVWLVDTRFALFGLNPSDMPAGWVHAMTMQYQVLPAFMFGFLLTVFPRWMNQAPFGRKHYVPVGVGLIAGQLCTLAGLLKLGALLTLAGWLIGTVLLVHRAWLDRARTWHAVSCAAALMFGALGLLLYVSYLYTQDARLIFAAIKIGSVAVLLPIYFTVCHRMIPFFAGAALPGYRPVRPMSALLLFWMLALVHVWLELRHGYDYLWLTDAPLTVLTAALLWTWWPWNRSQPPLLRVLFLGFAWLPIAFALYTLQSAWFATTGDFVLGRAPAHALFIGYFGSLLVAMVTRVTQGHSGRPLVLGKIAACTFIGVQLVAILRVLAELQADVMAWQAVAALGWLVAFLPWVLRSTWIYLTPRADGNPG
jgi:uncharacterized protein involved in response to NO